MSINSSNMIHILAALCIVVPSANAFSEKGLKAIYSDDNSTYGLTSFVNLPISMAEATANGWVNVTSPQLPTGYEALDLMCPSNDYTVCIHYDDTGYVAGLQIAFNPNKFTNAVFVWEEAGFANWTVDHNGTTTVYWATSQFYLSADDLAKPASVRVAARNSSNLIQGDYCYAMAFSNTLLAVPLNYKELSDSVYTEEACMAGMGTHYVYNMTSRQECSFKTMSTWFVLASFGKVVGVGFLMPGTYSIDAGNRDYFEVPDVATSKTLVPIAPECFYNYSNTTGLITMHIYYVEKPYDISCS